MKKNHTNDSLEAGRKLEAFSEQEQQNGHPYLYEIAIVRIWSILETMIDDLVASKIFEKKFSLESEVLGMVKLPLREVINSNPDQQSEFILGELKQLTKSRLQQGVGKFEVLLSAVNLGGPVEDDVRRLIFECCCVRNLIVHKNSVADSRFIDACPWFECSVGEKIALTRSHFLLYYFSAASYLLELDYRVDSTEGTEESFEQRDLKSTILATVHNLLGARQQEQQRTAQP